MHEHTARYLQGSGATIAAMQGEITAMQGEITELKNAIAEKDNRHPRAHRRTHGRAQRARTGTTRAEIIELSA